LLYGYTALIIGLTLFLGVHLIFLLPGVRERFINAIGLIPYKLGFAVIAGTGLYLAWTGRAEASYREIWNIGPGGLHIALTLMPFAILLVAGAYLSPGGKRLARHPMLSGVAIWAFAHLLANGDLASVMFFGGILAFSIIAQFMSDARLRRQDPQKWNDLARTTSRIPFLALLQRRTRDLPPLGGWPIVATIILYPALVFGHIYITGIALVAS